MVFIGTEMKIMGVSGEDRNVNICKYCVLMLIFECRFLLFILGC